MPITWHQQNAQTIKEKYIDYRPDGRHPTPWPELKRNANGHGFYSYIRVDARARGQYLFLVDNSPHNHSRGVHFAHVPVVEAYGHDNRFLGTCRVHDDKYHDVNDVVWEGSGNPNTAYFVVKFQIHPQNMKRSAELRTGWKAAVKYAPARM